RARRAGLRPDRLAAPRGEHAPAGDGDAAGRAPAVRGRRRGPAWRQRYALRRWQSRVPQRRAAGREEEAGGRDRRHEPAGLAQVFRGRRDAARVAGRGQVADGRPARRGRRLPRRQAGAGGRRRAVHAGRRSAAPEHWHRGVVAWRPPRGAEGVRGVQAGGSV
ncbi:unnamed protein product, partial [Prorocentrum cordatum]